VLTASAPSSPRLAGLDGIRGLSALYVVLSHIYLRSFPGYPQVTAPFWAGWLIYGHFAVAVFIVLSGFSLAVSPARTGWQLDGVARFARRRAWRILPPYWAALVFSLLVAWLLVPQPGLAAPDARSVLVNGLLLQDVIDATTPNRAFWSIAVEAHLYVLFPLLLLMVRRRSAIVMIAAAPVLATIAWRGSGWTIGGHLFWVDVALGPAIACLLVAVATDRPLALVRILDTQPLRSLGSFSYSLYLTHLPIVVAVNELVIAGRIRQGVPSFLVSVAVLVPLTILFARVFAAWFEIPFQTRRGWKALPNLRPAANSQVSMIVDHPTR
jgi:peptidoglycan/LPS O-acetylase OafA/YrhL